MASPVFSNFLCQARAQYAKIDDQNVQWAERGEVYLRLLLRPQTQPSGAVLTNQNARDTIPLRFSSARNGPFWEKSQIVAYRPPNLSRQLSYS